MKFLSPSRAGIGMLAAGVMLLAGCVAHRGDSKDSLASAKGSDLCNEVKGSWDGGAEKCSVVLTNSSGARLKIEAAYPVTMLDDSTTGPPLAEFVKKYFEQFGQFDDTYTKNGDVTLKYTPYESGDVKSVLFDTWWFFGGAAHPNSVLTSFVFDMRKPSRLALADLLCPGLDPTTALAPIVRPYVQEEVDKLNARMPQNSPLPVTEMEPVTAESGPHHTYVDTYDTWALEGDSLLVFLPSARLGPVSAGLIHPRIPLTALRSISRDGGCGDVA